MGSQKTRKALRPQQNEKKELASKPKKTLQEAASDMKAEMIEKNRQAAQRKMDLLRQIDEEDIALQIFGPARNDNAAE